MNGFHLTIFAFSIWRMAYFFTNESGPFKIALKLRELVGIEHDDYGDKSIIPDGYFPELLSCVYCLSLALSLFWYILYIAWPVTVIAILFPFAAGGFALVVNRHAK